LKNKFQINSMCPHCQSPSTRKTGFSPKTRHQRYRCNDCGKTWNDGDTPRGAPLIGDVRLSDPENNRSYRRRKKIEKLIDLDD
jgi:transposase-like protein